ncbi:ABC transporter permease [Thermosynechococcaceae cyanobacterium BACA0444]|uniref:ABC transporter permease n=1 Tax=Pseudocalidococcus azoricus BACA0444 TaxID=2918990 RepID=A0AAE4JYX2_9CYAN|nr:ABC transporter permease [Pseudocalidococcus azoricus]MDS3861464.1 ABC transporter permease [Pseudocalidococcus azoricus BACA0444]
MDRIWVLGRNVFQATFRERVLYITAVFAIFLTLAVVLLSEVSAGTENKITLDVGMGAISLFGLVVTAFVGSGLINREIEQRTALVMIAKPISRAEFIIGKHLGLAAVLAVLVALMTVIFFIVMSFKGFTYPAGAITIASIYLILELALLAAAAILFGVLTSSLIGTLLTLALYFMGHFSKNLITLQQRMEDGFVKSLINTIYLIVPDLSRLDLKNDAVYGILPSSQQLIINGVYGLVYTALLLSLATWIFSRRDF